MTTNHYKLNDTIPRRQNKNNQHSILLREYWKHLQVINPMQIKIKLSPKRAYVKSVMMLRSLQRAYMLMLDERLH
jgi:hypothetical protein